MGISADKFWSRVDVRGADECWPWLGCKTERGYEKLTIDGKTRYATHIALELDGKPRPCAPNDKALHRCDNPPCCNPGHLRWGSDKDNAHDQIDRGRFNFAGRIGGVGHGEAHPLSRLTERDVLAIRKSGCSTRYIANKYGIHAQTVRDIKNRKAWKHI